MMTEKDIYICYSPFLHKLLRDNGIRFLASGLHEVSLRKFWLYAKTPDVIRLLKEYSNNNKD